MERKTHTIDATGKVLGRLAVEISLLLRGKNKPGFAPHKDDGDFVTVTNAGKIKITGNKMEQKNYYGHSGYPGGFKVVSMKKVFDKNPGEVLRKAIMGMLPKNRLRAQQIKRLKFE